MIGQQISHYRITGKLGEGGMGVVYLATDTRLDRRVALKVLSERVSSDVRAKDRLDREARVISSLSHPHICALYDVGHDASVDFLAMEYLEGETLASRLRKGSLPMPDALRIAIQIAGALDHAHRKGVIHRDLKPGNIMLTRAGAKLLDFGLAKPAAIAPTEATRSELTAEGMFAGTLAYMAPEQFEGGEIDARSDLFAFGAVLYEMLSGRKAFEGKNQASVIASILRTEPPPLSSLQPVTPRELDRVVRKCLAKNPDDRWQTARDLASELEWVAQGHREPLAAKRSRLRRSWIATACAVAAASVLGLLYLRRPWPDSSRIHFTISAGLGGRGMAAACPSPDGSQIALGPNVASGSQAIFVRSIGSDRVEKIPNTEGGYLPFWSPDGRRLAFFADGKLKRVELATSIVQTICDAYSGLGGTWGASDIILFAPQNRAPLHRVPAGGGKSEVVTAISRERLENSHRWPQFLPDGRHFLFTARAARPENTAVWAGSLDSKDVTRILTVQSNVRYAPPGFLLYFRDGKLMAQPFDAERLRLSGEAQAMDAQVAYVPASALALFGLSLGGQTLVWRSGALETTQLTWFDRSGAITGKVGAPSGYGRVRISPDGKRAALVRPDERTGNRDLWLMDLESGIPSRFTFDEANDWWPVWSADGKHVFFSSDRDNRAVFRRPVSGLGRDEIFVRTEFGSAARDASPDGKHLVVHSFPHLWLVPLTGNGKPTRISQSDFTHPDARISPDSKWVAYVSEESGRSEVYVRNMPGAVTKGQWQVSSNGASEPAWRRDGKELFFLGYDDFLYSVVPSSSGAFDGARARPLFRSCAGHVSGPDTRSSYDVAPDGRFLFTCYTDEVLTAPIHVVLNWGAGLKP